MVDILDKTTSVNTTSTVEGREIKEIEHLMEKRQNNARVWRLYRELKKLDIGTNDIEQISANLVITKLNMEGIEEIGRSSNNVDPVTCWRDSKIVMKLIDMKISQIKK